jgi:hypothetical protein
VFAGDPAGRAEVILFRDRVPPDAWRRLAVRLRHASGAGSSEAAVSGQVKRARFT